jgi:hypothetical protein
MTPYRSSTAPGLRHRASGGPSMLMVLFQRKVAFAIAGPLLIVPRNLFAEFLVEPRLCCRFRASSGFRDRERSYNGTPSLSPTTGAESKSARERRRDLRGDCQPMSDAQPVRRYPENGSMSDANAINLDGCWAKIERANEN